MKRDPRLRALSTDHHHALVLVHKIRHEVRHDPVPADTVAHARQTFAASVLPHFEIEEALLLPALREIPEGLPLVERTVADHAAIRSLAAALDRGALARDVLEFAARLHDHVRFEEHELFPACERLLRPEVLDRVAAQPPRY
jgi:hypothetical protein